MPERHPSRQFAAILQLYPQQLESRDTECVIDPGDIVDRDVRPSSRHSANKSPVDLSPVRELLLTDAQFLSPSADVVRENTSELG